MLITIYPPVRAHITFKYYLASFATLPGQLFVTVTPQEVALADA